jgi:hypothetical protein
MLVSKLPSDVDAMWRHLEKRGVTWRQRVLEVGIGSDSKAHAHIMIGSDRVVRLNLISRVRVT